jgi:predicted N-acetyltransferase YhbS
MIRIFAETPSDITARENLLDCAFGPSRFMKTSERLREDRLPAAGLSFAAKAGGALLGPLLGTLRLWNITAGPDCPALLLGPLAVAESHRGMGLGGGLIRHGLNAAAALGHRAVLLVGDAPYYGRFGFDASLTERLWLPGANDRTRFLGLELVPGALTTARGMVSATGRLEPQPALGDLVGQLSREAPFLAA